MTGDGDILVGSGITLHFSYPVNDSFVGMRLSRAVGLLFIHPWVRRDIQMARSKVSSYVFRIPNSLIVCAQLCTVCAVLQLDS